MKIALSIAAIAATAVNVEGKTSVRGSRNLEVCAQRLGHVTTFLYRYNITNNIHIYSFILQNAYRIITDMKATATAASPAREASPVATNTTPSHRRLSR